MQWDKENIIEAQAKVILMMSQQMAELRQQVEYLETQLSSRQSESVCKTLAKTISPKIIWL